MLVPGDARQVLQRRLRKRAADARQAERVRMWSRRVSAGFRGGRPSLVTERRLTHG